MQVRDGMSEVSVTVGPSHTLRQAAAAMVARNVGAALVIDDETPTPGIVTERDLLLSVGETPERESFLAFSKPYITSNNIVVARRSNAAIGSIEDLAGTTVALEKGYAINDVLPVKVPGVKIVNVEDTEAALRAVAFCRTLSGMKGSSARRRRQTNKAQSSAETVSRPKTLGAPALLSPNASAIEPDAAASSAAPR